MLNNGDIIEYIRDVSEPASQKGSAGQIKTVGRGMTRFHARLLLKGGYIRPYDPDNPLVIEAEEENERSSNAGKEADQEGDNGPSGADPEGGDDDSGL